MLSATTQNGGRKVGSEETGEYRARLRKLDNGLTLITHKYPHPTSVGIDFRIAYGHLQNALESRLPVAHFLEHLMFGGTKKLSKIEGWRLRERLCASADGVTSLETTSYEMLVHKDRTEQSLSLLGDMLSNPSFDPEDIELEREPISNEYLGNAGSPSYLAYERLMKESFGNHPAGRSTQFTPEEVARVTRHDILTAHRLKYAKDASVLAVYGPLDEEKVAEIAEKAFAKLPDAQEKTKEVFQAPMRRQGKKIISTSSRTDLSLIRMGMKRPSAGRASEQANLAFSLAMIVLWKNLTVDLRLKKGLIYQARVSNDAGSSYGLLRVSVDVNPDKEERVLELIEKNLNSLSRDGISQERLREEKSIVKERLEMADSNVSEAASTLTAQNLQHVPLAAFDDYKIAVGALTLDDIRSAAEYLDPSKAITVLVRPSVSSEPASA